MPGIMTIKGDLDPAGNEVKELIVQVREKNRAHNLKNREKIMDFYMNRQYLDEYLKNYGFDDDYPLSTVNITKKIIDKISLVYKNPPDRRLEKKNKPKPKKDENGNDVKAEIIEEVDQYQEFINDHPEFNVGLRVAERLKNALHVVLYRPMWYGDNWNFNWIETEWESVYQEGNPLRPIGYFIPMKRDSYMTDKRLITENKYMYWSKDQYFWVDEHGNISYDPEYPDGVNPFKRLPFIEMRKELAVDDPWPEGAIDLVSCNQAINIIINDLNMSIRYQSFDQTYIEGIDEKDAGKFKRGPNKTWYTNHPESKFGNLTFQPKIEATIAAIQKQIDIIAWAYGVHVDWELSGSPASGFSMMVQNIDLLEAREDDVQFCQMYEKELYDIIQVQTEVLDTDTKTLPKLGNGLKLVVDFQEIDFPINEAEKRDADDWAVEHNIKSEIDLIQEANPDMDEEEAKEKWLKNKQLNTKYSYRQQMVRDEIKNQGGEIINEPDNKLSR